VEPDVGVGETAGTAGAGVVLAGVATVVGNRPGVVNGRAATTGPEGVGDSSGSSRSVVAIMITSMPTTRAAKTPMAADNIFELGRFVKRAKSPVGGGGCESS
jgi:hypothetical protein